MCNIFFMSLLFCSAVVCTQSVAERNPFECVHEHGSFKVAHIEQAHKDIPQEEQPQSDWHIVEQNGSEVVMQDLQGHIRKISLAQNKSPLTAHQPTPRLRRAGPAVSAIAQ